MTLTVTMTTPTPCNRQVCNAVRDCGLLPEWVTPTYCLLLSYHGTGAKFTTHRDSPKRWVGAATSATFLLMQYASSCNMPLPVCCMF